METQNLKQNQKYTILFKDVTADTEQKVMVYVPEITDALRIRDHIGLREPYLKYQGLILPSGALVVEGEK